MLLHVGLSVNGPQHSMILLLCVCSLCSIHDYQSQLKSLGQDVTGNRGKMLHLILTICQKVEKAFNKIVDGGEGGGACAGWRGGCGSPVEKPTQHHARRPPAVFALQGCDGAV